MLRREYCPEAGIKLFQCPKGMGIQKDDLFELEPLKETSVVFHQHLKKSFLPEKAIAISQGPFLFA
jgi:hypothetical protein